MKTAPRRANVRGHDPRSSPLSESENIPYGYCQCGCGEKAPIAPLTSNKRGWKKGRPVRFVHGHNGRIPLNRMYRVEDRGFTTPCWVWGGGTTNDGRYGRTQYEGRMIAAHRATYAEAHGALPPPYPEKHLDHLCEVTLCVNPDHLEVVTPAENTRRAMKLTYADVAAIRAEYARVRRPGRKRVPPGTVPRLAEQYGVDEKTIKNVAAGRTWA